MEYGSSKSKLPLFNGPNYSYWKCKMQMYLKSLDLDVWDIVTNGPFVPTKRVGEVEMLKSREEYTPKEKKKVLLENRAMNVYRALSIRNSIKFSIVQQQMKYVIHFLLHTKEHLV